MRDKTGALHAVDGFRKREIQKYKFRSNARAQMRFIYRVFYQINGTNSKMSKKSLNLVIVYIQYIIKYPVLLLKLQPPPIPQGLCPSGGRSSILLPVCF
jgi:hypothetical protein